MEEKESTSNKTKTRENNIEYNSLVSSYRTAYHGLPAQRTTIEAQKIWTTLKERYVMGMLFILILF